MLSTFTTLCCQHVPRYAVNMYHVMLSTCTTVCCQHVPRYAVNMYHVMLSTCTTVCCQHVPRYAAACTTLCCQHGPPVAFHNYWHVVCFVNITRFHDFPAVSIPYCLNCASTLRDVHHRHCSIRKRCRLDVFLCEEEKTLHQYSAKT